jgi:hypothetical protein
VGLDSLKQLLADHPDVFVTASWLQPRVDGRYMPTAIRHLQSSVPIDPRGARKARKADRKEEQANKDKRKALVRAQV